MQKWQERFDPNYNPFDKCMLDYDGVNDETQSTQTGSTQTGSTQTQQHELIVVNQQETDDDDDNYLDMKLLLEMCKDIFQF